MTIISASIRIKCNWCDCQTFHRPTKQQPLPEYWIEHECMDGAKVLRLHFCGEYCQQKWLDGFRKAQQWGVK